VFEPERDGIDLHLVPLVGHTRGQVGVAVGTDDGWLLHCADSYFCLSEVAVARPQCTPGLRFLQWYVQVSNAARRANQARLRELKRREPGLVTFCSHDPDEFDRLSSGP
jgi:glyoxylase-like metal-dependent hydrolase (beta-lactamase superfamily II)